MSANHSHAIPESPIKSPTTSAMNTSDGSHTHQSDADCEHSRHDDEYAFEIELVRLSVLANGDSPLPSPVDAWDTDPIPF